MRNKGTVKGMGAKNTKLRIDIDMLQVIFGSSLRLAQVEVIYTKSLDGNYFLDIYYC